MPAAAGLAVLGGFRRKRGLRCSGSTPKDEKKRFSYLVLNSHLPSKAGTEDFYTKHLKTAKQGRVGDTQNARRKRQSLIASIVSQSIGTAWLPHAGRAMR